MNVLQRAWNAFAGRFFNSTLASPQRWLLDILRSNESDSGISVNGKTAISYPPIWYAVNKIGGHIGQLPLSVIQQDPNDRRIKEKAVRHRGYKVMKQPNELMTGPVFRETLQHHALLWGNGRAAIIRNNRQEPVELTILRPDCTKTVVVDGQKWHVVEQPDTGTKYKILDIDVLHIPGLGFDGISGYSVIEIARNSIGMGLAAEKYGNRLYRSNATPGMVLEAPPGVFRDESEAKEFIDRWNEYHQGLDNVGRTALLREGIKATPLSMNGRDAQWVEQRKFQRQDAALIMLLEQILGDDSSVSYNSLEQKNLAYLINCLMRWIVKWEFELNGKLLSTRERDAESHYFKFNVAGLLRGSIKERFDVYEKARMMGILSANECRELEDLNPREGGDSYDNPATTAGGSGTSTVQTDKDSSSDAIETTTEEMDTTNARVRNLIVSRLRDVTAGEVKRIKTAASKERNFVKWLDEFYTTSPFMELICHVHRQLGGNDATATSYAGESKALLLDIAGSCTSETFVESIDKGTVDWLNRADQMADIITTIVQGWMDKRNE
jgi:HK97 family phage portal protein